MRAVKEFGKIEGWRLNRETRLFIQYLEDTVTDSQIYNDQNKELPVAERICNVLELAQVSNLKRMSPKISLVYRILKQLGYSQEFAIYLKKNYIVGDSTLLATKVCYLQVSEAFIREVYHIKGDLDTKELNPELRCTRSYI